MSEVSVALAGFSVLMFSLRRAEGPRALFRAHATVASAFLSLAIALAPQLLGRLGFERDAIWALSNALCVLLMGPFTLVMLARHRELGRLGFPAQVGSRIYPVLAYSSGVAATAVSLANFGPWSWGGAAGFHLALCVFALWPVMAIVASFAVEWDRAIGEARSQVSSAAR